MALTEERTAYYLKLIEDYEGFITREHESGFYTAILPVINKTNSEHILYLIKDANEQLLKAM